MTETITHGTVGSPHLKDAPMSMGRPSPGYGIHVLDEAGAPVRPGVVRVTRYQGGWTIRPAGAGQVEVTTRGYADLGGAVPLSLANRLVPQQLYRMMSNMREHVRQPEFRKLTASLN